MINVYSEKRIRCRQCGSHSLASKTMCSVCLAKHNARSRARKHKHKTAGTCVECGASPVIGIRCRACHDKNNDRARLKKREFVNTSRCVDCGQPIVDNSGRLRCVNCAENIFNFRWE